VHLTREVCEALISPTTCENSFLTTVLEQVWNRDRRYTMSTRSCIHEARGITSAIKQGQ
jgi:hypothetical protein